jgi:hypothetical protein
VAVGDTCTISSANPTYWNTGGAPATWTVTSVPSTSPWIFYLNIPNGGTATASSVGVVRCTVTTPPVGDATDFAKLQDDFSACKGSNLPSACTDTSNLLGQVQAARREAREIVLAYMAGAAPVPSDDGWKRASDDHALLYTAKIWPLADSEATAAVLAYPVEAQPSVYTDQYSKYLYGVVGDNDGKGVAQSKAGFGLRTPDGTAASPRTELNLKPVMTVVYVPSNDMLHAFRAGPTFAPSNIDTNNLGCRSRGRRVEIPR